MINYARWIYWMNLASLVFSLLSLLAMYGIHRQQEMIMENIQYASCDGFAYDQDNAPAICK